mmetsp:Transcript_135511/g.234476  ORF Transcript_135511/g.234476 Transcript_135511/m.234476 type:complete len:211 (-) Transcript_135511:339-971(-)
MQAQLLLSNAPAVDLLAELADSPPYPQHCLKPSHWGQCCLHPHYCSQLVAALVAKCAGYPPQQYRSLSCPGRVPKSLPKNESSTDRPGPCPSSSPPSCHVFVSLICCRPSPSGSNHGLASSCAPPSSNQSTADRPGPTANLSDPSSRLGDSSSHLSGPSSAPANCLQRKPWEVVEEEAPCLQSFADLVKQTSPALVQLLPQSFYHWSMAL